MKAVCVDKDDKTLELAAEVCGANPLLTEVKCFTCARDCLLWLETNSVNLAILEVELTEEEQALPIPECLAVVAEVTEDRRFKNRGMAERIPDITPFLSKL